MRVLRAAPRWLLLAALLYAPWAYGCTTPETIAVLNWLLATTLGLWLLGAVLSSGVARIGRSSRRQQARPLSIPRGLVATAIALLVVGWGMVLNAHTIFDADDAVWVTLLSPWLQGPGSVDQSLSAAAMIRLSLLLGVTMFVADLSQRAMWLVRLWWTVAIAGGSIALLGLLQKALGAEMIFWQTTEVWWAKTFFASYYYHANAGAYLNLALPLALGLAIRGWLRPTAPIARAATTALALITTMAIFSNTSRMAQLLGAGLLAAVAVGPGRRAVRSAWMANWKLTLLAVGVAGFTAIAIGQASQLDKPVARWQQLWAHASADERWLVAGTALRAAPDAGAFGFGPGTFRVVFPHYLGGENEGDPIWRFLHQDYLQTILEWGWMGAALWALYLFGGVVLAVKNRRSPVSAEWAPRQRLLLPLVVMALTATALHALVDFPLQIASLQLYVATYLGLCWGSGKWDG